MADALVKLNVPVLVPLIVVLTAFAVQAAPLAANVQVSEPITTVFDSVPLKFICDELPVDVTLKEFVSNVPVTKLKTVIPSVTNVSESCKVTDPPGELIMIDIVYDLPAVVKVCVVLPEKVTVEDPDIVVPEPNVRLP